MNNRSNRLYILALALVLGSTAPGLAETTEVVTGNASLGVAGVDGDAGTITINHGDVDASADAVRVEVQNVDIPDEQWVVASGQSLSQIAKEKCGSYDAWRHIYEANRDKISNPDIIQPGWELTIRCSAEDAAEPVVQEPEAPPPQNLGELTDEQLRDPAQAGQFRIDSLDDSVNEHLTHAALAKEFTERAQAALARTEATPAGSDEAKALAQEVTQLARDAEREANLARSSYTQALANRDAALQDARRAGKSDEEIEAIRDSFAIPRGDGPRDDAIRAAEQAKEYAEDAADHAGFEPGWFSRQWAGINSSNQGRNVELAETYAGRVTESLRVITDKARVAKQAADAAESLAEGSPDAALQQTRLADEAADAAEAALRTAERNASDAAKAAERAAIQISLAPNHAKPAAREAAARARELADKAQEELGRARPLAQQARADAERAAQAAPDPSVWNRITSWHNTIQARDRTEEAKDSQEDAERLAGVAKTQADAAVEAAQVAVQAARINADYSKEPAQNARRAYLRAQRAANSARYLAGVAKSKAEYVAGDARQAHSALNTEARELAEQAAAHAAAAEAAAVAAEADAARAKEAFEEVEQYL